MFGDHVSCYSVNVPQEVGNCDFISASMKEGKRPDRIGKVLKLRSREKTRPSQI